ncbi:MAG TPA: DUF1254 domain-containing protein, partial [Acidimicrobiales bacterium]
MRRPSSRPASRPANRRRRAIALGVVAVTLAACSSGTSSSSDSSSTTRAHVTAPSEPSTTVAPAEGSREAVARDAALAGYPLVTTVRTMQLFAGLTGVNTLLRTAMLAGPSTRLIVAPNHDTVYAIAVLDLRAGPQALTVPSITDRYYTFQVIDAWMGTVANIGTGATKSAAGTWVVVPPGFHGTLPAGVHRVDSPSNQLFVLGRFRAVDDADAAAAHADSSRVTLQSLATYERQPGPTQAAPSMAKPVGRPQTVGANGMGFYDELAAALVANPPPNADDRRAITAVRALGVVAGGHPSTSTSSAERAVLLQGLADANDRAASTALLGNHLVDGWSVNL